METNKYYTSSLQSYSRSYILIKDDSLIEATSQGRVVLENGYFENVLHLPKLCVNRLLVY